MARPIPVLYWPERSIVLSARYISVAISYSLRWDLKVLQTQFPVLILLIVLPQNQGYKPDYIGMKISVLPPTQLVFAVLKLKILQQILQISA